ncbi:MAG: AbrB/MazE/SpoVT family DNA-binding domain-containing protein [Microbacterium sp.]
MGDVHINGPFHFGHPYGDETDLLVSTSCRALTTTATPTPDSAPTPIPRRVRITPADRDVIRKKVNTKGQITIPADLRRKHGFAEGDSVDVVDDGGALRIVHRDGLTAGERAVRRLRGKAGAGPTTDDVLALTRG